MQIWDIPEDVYETIRKRARAAGQSIPAYMREQVIDLAVGRRLSPFRTNSTVGNLYKRMTDVGIPVLQV